MKNKLSSIFSMVAIAGVALLSCVSLTGCGTKTVDLSKYVTVTFDGYDSIGTASVTFDTDKFEKDFKDIKIKKTNEKVIFAQRLGETSTDILRGCFNSSLDKSTGLSNGDNITCEIKVDEQTLSCFGDIKVSSTSIPFTVNGLKDVEKFNPFDEITVTFGGDNNDRQVVINSPKTDIWKSLSVIYSRKDTTSRTIKAGDTITVQILFGNPVFLIEKYNKIPIVTEKDFTVSSFAEYPSTLAAIGDKAIENFKNTAIEKIKSDLESNTMYSNINVDYVGAIYKSSKSGYPERIGLFSSVVNRYYVVAKVSADVTYTNINYGTVEAYMVLGWDNVEKDSNGEIYADYNDSFGESIINDVNNFPWRASITGYKTLEEIDEAVENDKFDIEKNF